MHCIVSRWYFIGKEFTTRNTEEGSSDDTMKTATCFVGSVISEDGMYSWKFDGSQQKVVLVLVSSLTASCCCLLRLVVCLLFVCLSYATCCCYCFQFIFVQSCTPNCLMNHHVLYLITQVEDNDCHLPDPSLFYFKSQPSIPNQYTISHYDSVEGNVVLSDCIQWNAETKEMESLQTAAGTAGSNIQFTISGLPTECVYWAAAVNKNCTYYLHWLHIQAITIVINIHYTTYIFSITILYICLI